MKVTRGRYFEGDDGVWEKVEVELGEDDLLDEEALVEAHLRPLLLEIRAEQQLVSTMRRLGQLDPDVADEISEELRAARKRLFALNRRSNPPSRLLSKKD